MLRLFVLLVPCALALAQAGAGTASAITLADFDTSVEITTDVENGLGLDWSVGDTLYVSQFFGVEGPDVSLETVKVVDTNAFDPSEDTATLLFGTEDDPVMLVTILLRGSFSDPRQADIAESIEVFNPGDEPIVFRQSVQLYFQGEFVPPETEDPLFANLLFTDGSIVFEEAVNPTPDDQVAGQAEFSLAWEVAPGETLLLSKDKRLLVPEPSAAILLALGLLGLTRAGRRP